MANVMKDRDNKVLEAAIELAKIEGYQWITRETVAKMAGCAVGTINNAYGSMRELKRAVLREAVARQIHVIVAQGLADKHPIVMEAPADLRKAVALQMAD